MNIIFAGSPAPSAKILERLCLDGVNIPLVITQPDKRGKRGSEKNPSEVSKAASKLNLNVIKPLDLEEHSFKELIGSVESDFIVVSAYGKILPTWLLEHPKFLSINIHYSLLPKYRGASPIHAAIINGDKKTGISFIKMNSKMDEGDIIKMLPIDINDNEKKEEVEERLSSLAAENITSTLQAIIENKLVYKKQNANDATYCFKVKKSDGEIDFNNSSESIIRMFNAYKSWPGAFFLFKDITIKVHNMHIDKSIYLNKPGSIIDITSEGITVKTIDYAIVITYLQFPNKKIITSQDAVNSYLDFFTN